MIDMNAVKNIHFIGIGGVSNSAIAEILAENGYSISGSDISASEFTKSLENKGISVYIGHHAKNIQNPDLVVYTAAVSEDNPELVAALSLKIPCLSRAEMLGELMLGYKNSIAISGTHGKTTTTSMVTRLFNDEAHDPTALIGGFFNDIASNVRIGKSDLFITEACEYKESFLSFFPRVGVILNIEEDHLDYYRDLDHIVSAFVSFTKNIHEKGVLVINGDDYNSRKILPYYKGKTLTFGQSDHCELKAKNVTYNHFGCASFDVYRKEERLCQIDLTIPGTHHVYNALASFAVGLIFSLPVQVIQTRLNTFKNANRRFEYIGKINGVTVVDDYAHHPSEIRANLDATSKMENFKRTFVIFQPHTFSRTKELLHGFASAFLNADQVLVCDIYAAREVDPGDIHSKHLVQELLKENVNAMHMASFEAAVTYLKANTMPDDLVITMGAGDVYKIGKLFLQ